MKHFVTTLSWMILGLITGSSAFAYCPDHLAAGLGGEMAKNYDGTCTITPPTLTDRGVLHLVTGQLDKVCEVFGFGAKAGVAQVEAFNVEGFHPIKSLSGPGKNGYYYESITCRQKN